MLPGVETPGYSQMSLRDKGSGRRAKIVGWIDYGGLVGMGKEEEKCLGKVLTYPDCLVGFPLF